VGSEMCIRDRNDVVLDSFNCVVALWVRCAYVLVSWREGEEGKKFKVIFKGLPETGGPVGRIWGGLPAVGVGEFAVWWFWFRWIVDVSEFAKQDEFYSDCECFVDWRPEL